MLKRIRRFFRHYRYRHASIHVIPQLLHQRDKHAILDQNRFITQLLMKLIQDEALVIRSDLMQIERVNGPYQNLEEAHAHGLVIQRHIDAHQSVDVQLLTFANQSIAVREWFKNHEGYYLTLQDLAKWLTVVDQITEALDNLQIVDQDTFTRSHDALLSFSFRIRDILAALYQFYMLNLEPA